MNCPVCDDRMKEVERQGVAIDICPSCKGVWLDRGELEKLIEMSRQEEGSAPVAPRSGPPADQQERRPEYTERRDDHHDDHGHRDDRSYERGRDERGSEKPRRRSSLLGDILGAFGEGGD